MCETGRCGSREQGCSDRPVAWVRVWIHLHFNVWNKTYRKVARVAHRSCGAVAGASAIGVLPQSLLCLPSPACARVHTGFILNLHECRRYAPWHPDLHVRSLRGTVLSWPQWLLRTMLPPPLASALWSTFHFCRGPSSIAVGLAWVACVFCVGCAPSLVPFFWTMSLPPCVAPWTFLESQALAPWPSVQV